MNKDVLLILCALITVGAIAGAVYTFEKQGKLSRSLQEERYGRMVAEEISQKSAAKLIALENQLKSTDDKLAKLKDILDQQKSVNSDLKGQYDKLVQAKADMEAKLKTAMEEKPVVPPPAPEAAPQAELPSTAAGAQ